MNAKKSPQKAAIAIAVMVWLAGTLALPVIGAEEDVYLEVTVTNGTVHLDALTVNGDTRTATNNTAPDPAHLFLLHGTNTWAKTNLFNQIALYPFDDLSLEDISTNRFRLYNFGGSIAFSFAGNWATGVLVTNISGTNRITVDVPPTVFDADTRKEVASGLVSWLTYATNTLPQTASAWVDYVAVSTHQSMTNKDIHASTNRSGQITNTEIRHAFMSGPTVPWYGNTNQSRIYFGTNSGPPWIGYLAPSTNGHLGMFDTNGAPLFIVDNFAVQDEMLLPWQDLKAIFPSRAAGYHDVKNIWDTVNQWDAGTNIFSSHLAVWAGLHATGQVAHINTNIAQWSWATNLHVPGTARSGITNVDGVFNYLRATNVQIVATPGGGASSSNVVHLDSSHRGDTIFYEDVFMGRDVRLLFPNHPITTVANGHNRIDVGTNTFVSIDGSPSSPWSLGGITSGSSGQRDGQMVILRFNTGLDVTIRNESGDETIAANRILTLNGGDAVSSGNAIGIAWYLGDPVERWIFAFLNRGAGTQSGVQATNAIEYLDGEGTNLTVFASSTNKVALTVHQRANVYSNILQVIDSAGAELFAVKSNGAVAIARSVPRGGNLFLNPLRQRWAMGWASVGGLWSQVGDNPSHTGTQTFIAPTATEGPMFNMASSASLGADAGENGQLNYWNARNPILRVRVKLQESAAMRVWIGFSDQTLSTMVASDNPAGNYAAFRFSTDASDVNWQAVTKDNTTQGITDTGKAFDTAVHALEVIVDNDNSKVYFLIDDALVATRTANLPGTGLALRYVCGLETREAVAKNIRFEQVQAMIDF